MVESRILHTRSAQETHRLGSEIGQALTAGTVVALSGELGAGKTTLTQGIAAGMGIQARVTSPTFTLVNEYEIGVPETVGAVRLIHMDSYRLGDSTEAALPEAETLGIEEMLDDEDAVIVIEWAERLNSLLPDDHLQITLSHDAADVDRRRVMIVAAGPRGAAVLGQLDASDALN